MRGVLARLGDARGVPLDYRSPRTCPSWPRSADEYRRLHRRPTRDVPGVRFYSGATGEAYRPTADRAADAILAQAVGTVDFVAGVERAWADGVRVFVEHGPQALCTGWIRRILAAATTSPSRWTRDGRGVRQLLVAAAELVAAGVPVRASALVDHLAAAAGRPRGPRRRAPARRPPARTAPARPATSRS